MQVSAFVRLRYQALPDDLFIVTYPKSGTTIVQVMVCALRGSTLESCGHIAEQVPWLEEAAIRRAEVLEGGPRPRCFKPHLKPSRLPGDARVIYVRRDIEDVDLSYWKYRIGAQGNREDLDDFVKTLVKGKLRWGSWSDHVTAWSKHRHEPRVLWLEFAELVADLRGHAERVADFAGLVQGPEREERIAAAVEACSFESMRANWHKLDPRLYAPGQEPGFRFVREGRVGAGKEALSPAARELLRRATAKVPR